MSRLAAGGRIDRTRPLGFRFDGQAFAGFQGDTLASALIGNGVHLVGRSFKYHRPRGIMAAGADEPNALVTVSRDPARVTPNLLATQVELYDGLTAESQNRGRSLRRDRAAINDVLAPLLPAGFYYKTFMWPPSAWHKVYEPRIRAVAGLGRAPLEADPDRYAQRYAHCDVLVVGAGPAGLAAAQAAAEAGAQVILCDEQAEPGGSLLSEPRGIAGLAPIHPGVLFLPRTTAFGYFAHNMLGLAERLTDHLPSPLPDRPRERLWQVRAREVVLCTGAHERPMVFPGNDRPGIMLAGAALTYAARYGALPGRRAVVSAGHDSAYAAALALRTLGVEIAAIVDPRPGERLAGEAARRAGIPVHSAADIAGTAGRFRVRRAFLRDRAGRLRSEACDLVLMSGGWTPSVHLFSQSRGKLRYDPAHGGFVPGAPAERQWCAGACNGAAGTAEAAAAGLAAGGAAAAAARAGGPRTPRPAPPHPPASHAPPRRGAQGQGKAFVDFQNDVTVKDLLLATREGFHSIEHVKRYTTTGMATDQGKTSNLNALEIVAGALGRPVPAVGLTTFRMPYTPVSFGLLAGAARGALFDPVRTTPMHAWSEAHGAVFEDVGAWKRARYYPQPSEGMHAAVARECRAVREACGVFDASTLGKIEVVGPDAAAFMERMYVNAWAKLAPGRCRYGVMLKEDGFLLDDGVVGRLAPDRFHVTTTTGGAARVLGHMEDYRQTEWPGLDVWLTSTTEQWAVIAVQGPRARAVLAPLVEGADLAMPHMSVQECRVAGIPARLFRVSFTGELGFEVNVPSGQGRAVWEAVMAGGAVPYGTEAMHVLRAEKGYIIIGQETDATCTPDDVGLAWAIGKSKPDFVGKRGLARAGMADASRRQLVGLLTHDPACVLEEGAQVVAGPHAPVPAPMAGWVTSSYASATLGRSIALAMLPGGRARLGETVLVPMPGRMIAATVAGTAFHDPEGTRLHG